MGLKNIALALAVFAVLLLVALFLAGIAEDLPALLLVALPYGVLILFTVGFVHRTVRWANLPVPFPIVTTCGQQRSLSWIRTDPLECPSGPWGVAARMALEVVLFRSLFRNSRVALMGGRPVYASAKGLWMAALLFHAALGIVCLRHLCWFTDPAISWAGALSSLDGFLETGTPTLYMSDAILVTTLLFLLARRLVVPTLRYISLAADYIPLLLLLGIGISGLWMRHLDPVDLYRVKALTMGWVHLDPGSPRGIGTVFYVHLFLVCALAASFPFTKLMHMGGIFLSPTRNLANDSRMRRHVNPWNRPVQVHTYEQYEDEFRDKMKAAGLPVEKE
jgi:nitrate reductase gamma subunit